MFSLCANCLWRCLACLVTIGRERKQGNNMSSLEGANFWRLHRRQDQIRTAICPKVRLNIWINNNRPHIKVTLFSYLLLFCFFKSPWDSLVRSSYIQLHWIVSQIPFLQGGPWQTFPLTDLHTSLVFETYLKLGKLQCNSNFNRNELSLLMKEIIKPNYIVNLHFCPLSPPLCHVFPKLQKNIAYKQYMSLFNHVKTARARGLTFWDSINHTLCVICPVSPVRCQVSLVSYHM